MVNNTNKIRATLERLVDDLITGGKTPEDALADLASELEALSSAFKHDPDPVDDPIDLDNQG